MRQAWLMLVAGALSAVRIAGAGLPAQLFDGLSWRMIGPFRGGRAIAVTGVAGDGRTFYFGAVGGGIWKTTDAGTVWTPVFDGQDIASIGAVEVAPSSPNVIYAGTGEADMRSDIGFGDGVYKSIDGGRTWTNLGLEDSRQIGRIIIHPENPDIVYVAALGHAYGPNAERGVYRTIDGGATWRKVLDKGPDVGAIDLSMSPTDPKTIYAAMWQARRTPWSMYPPEGGPGSGLYKTADGGETWTQLTGHGLPDGPWGRVAVAAASATRVYALIDAKAAGLYRSDDGGATWTLAGSDPRITSRAWYFGQITVNPSDPDDVFIPNVALMRSKDAGETFDVIRGAPGGDDYHQLWIDRKDPARMILGSDQGAVISVDGARTWTTWYNQPTGQFYHVITDNGFPYYVYGAQQDSGSMAVASRSDHGVIDGRDWFAPGGGESGYIAPDPRDGNIVFSGDTYGGLMRTDRRTWQAQNISPWPAFRFGTGISERKYRATWTSPLVFSPADPSALYFGTQYVLRSTDGGSSWKEISPDLTGDERKGPRDAAPSGPLTMDNARQRGFGVVYTIAPSPLEAQVIWAGSDSGLIHVTRDGGRSWQNVTPPALTPWSKIALIEASHFDAATAYAAVDRHRLDDYRPYIYRTRDFGRTWTLIVDGLAEPAFVNAVREDPIRRGLLLAGTEKGVMVSFDDGDHWQSLQLNLPVVSVRDLAIHDGDLAIATHGRAFWILDNISPLRQAQADIASGSAYLYAPSAAWRLNPMRFSGTPLPPETPQAPNPPNGAMIDYYLRSGASGPVKIEIYDAGGKLVRKFSSEARPAPAPRAVPIAAFWRPSPAGLSTKPGMHRFVWDLRYPSPGPSEDEEAEFSGFGGGPQVLPGTYEVRLIANGQTYTQPLTVRLDPRSKASAADLADQLALGLKAVAKIQECHGFKKGSAPDDIVAACAAATSDLTAVLGVAESADRRPTAAAYALYDDAARRIDAAMARMQPHRNN
jgi:photosystem II stability/assembly factor-like uncharacterized protein